jgi:hypothetical protein
MTLTVAPETTPPLVSVTVPMMRPRLPCENAGTQSKSTAKETVSNLIAFQHQPPEDPSLVFFIELISGPRNLRIEI